MRMGDIFSRQKETMVEYFTEVRDGLLMDCPECSLKISDKALSCPHCGYPLVKIEAPKKRRSTKPMRLPNGFGSIVKITGKPLRKPYRVMVTVGFDKETGRYICKILKPQGYFETYQEAYEALLEYKKNPYDLSDDITVLELYERWSEEYFKTLASDSSIRTVESAWQYCSEIYGMRVKDVRARHMKGVMENGYRVETKGKKTGEKIFPSANIKSRIKSLFNLMFDYALEYELVDKNYARTFEISEDIIKEVQEVKNGHIIFAEEELNILWNNVENIKFVDWILIQCYMGWRPQELGLLEIKNISLENLTITGGMKTEAGKMRTVPIHSRIIPLVEKNIKLAKSIGSEYLLNDKGRTHSGSYFITYDKYSDRFMKVMKELGLNPDHKAHDPRKTFVTRLKKAGVSDGAVKKLVGHKESDITESAYTTRDIEWLRSDIEKMV